MQWITLGLANTSLGLETPIKEMYHTTTMTTTLVVSIVHGKNGTGRCPLIGSLCGCTPDGLVNHVVDTLGVPKEVLFPQAQIEQTRQQRAAMEAEQMQRQQDAEDVSNVAQAAQAVRMVNK